MILKVQTQHQAEIVLIRTADREGAILPDSLGEIPPGRADGRGRNLGGGCRGIASRVKNTGYVQIRSREHRLERGREQGEILRGQGASGIKAPGGAVCRRPCIGIVSKGPEGTHSTANATGHSAGQRIRRRGRIIPLCPLRPARTRAGIKKVRSRRNELAGLSGRGLAFERGGFRRGLGHSALDRSGRCLGSGNGGRCGQRVSFGLKRGCDEGAIRLRGFMRLYGTGGVLRGADQGRASGDGSAPEKIEGRREAQ
ncbi:hypothetical protein EB061_10445 [bacterium]|nr:hypothetical protein [bacterium]